MTRTTALSSFISFTVYLYFNSLQFLTSRFESSWVHAFEPIEPHRTETRRLDPR